jgi:hypothetical protein
MYNKAVYLAIVRIIIQINSVTFFSACQQRVAYNRRALNVYITEATLRLELELDNSLILGNKTVQLTQ